MRQVLVVSIAALFAGSAGGCALVGFPAPAPAPVPLDATVPPDLPPNVEPGAVRDLPSPSPTRTYEVLGQVYTTLPSSEGYAEVGLASWYGEKFQGRRTASGERFDMYAFTAAHRTLPLNTCVEVTRVADGRMVRVRVNDRGPFDDDASRVIDVSFAAAQKLGLIGPGTASVSLRAVETGTSC